MARGRRVHQGTLQMGKVGDLIVIAQKEAVFNIIPLSTSLSPDINTINH